MANRAHGGPGFFPITRIGREGAALGMGFEDECIKWGVGGFKRRNQQEKMCRDRRDGVLLFVKQ